MMESLTLSFLFPSMTTWELYLPQFHLQIHLHVEINQSILITLLECANCNWANFVRSCYCNFAAVWVDFHRSPTGFFHNFNCLMQRNVLPRGAYVNMISSASYFCGKRCIISKATRLCFFTTIFTLRLKINIRFFILNINIRFAVGCSF